MSSLRNLARTGSGAITKIAFIWLPAAVRALTAERRASWSGRRPPIAGSLTRLDRSANTARAAWLASNRSDFPARRRADRVGRSTSTTLIPALARAPGDAGAVAGRPFHADPVNDPLIGEELDRAGITDGGSGELGVANHLADRGQHRDMDGVDVRVDPPTTWTCAAMMESSLLCRADR